MKNINENTCFYSDDFSDWRGKLIKLRWSEKLWITHLNKHPEIISPDNTSRLISEAISEPSLVITGYRPGNTKSAKEMLC